MKTELINVQDENGETSLHLAARIGHRRIVELFLFAGADVNIKLVVFSNGFFYYLTCHFLNIHNDNVARSDQGIEPIQLIYEKVPYAMCAVFDTAIQYRSGDVGDENYEIVMDFG